VKGRQSFDDGRYPVAELARYIMGMRFSNPPSGNGLFALAERSNIETAKLT
jgi:hypothetical protein